jgi:hypothetical protein
MERVVFRSVKHSLAIGMPKAGWLDPWGFLLICLTPGTGLSLRVGKHFPLFKEINATILSTKQEKLFLLFDYCIT